MGSREDQREGDIGAGIAAGIARNGGEELRAADRERSGRSGDIDAGDMRTADGDVGVADFLADLGADGDFTGLEEGDFAGLLGAGGVEGSSEPEFNGIGERLAGGVFGDGFELELATDGGGGMGGSDFDGGDFGGCREFGLRVRGVFVRRRSM